MRKLIIIFSVLIVIWMILSIILLARKIKLKKAVGPKEKIICNIVAGANLLFALLMVYGFLIEPNLLETTTHSIESAKIDSPNSIRIVQISDIHAPSSKSLWNRIENEISNSEPDLIVFTGDAVNKRKNYDSTMMWFQNLSTIAPLYAIRGNADTLEFKNYFDSGNAIELDGHIYQLQINDVQIYLIGSSSPEGWGRLYSIFRNRDSNVFTVYLGHSPDPFENISDWGADLYLAGHTHGGQISLPFYGALWTGSMYGKKYERGFYSYNNSLLYINRGIGMSYTFPPLRLGSRPEISIFDLSGVQ